MSKEIELKPRVARSGRNLRFRLNTPTIAHIARDKASLDITWLRDESLEDADDLPPPEVIARQIVEDLAAALAEFAGSPQFPTALRRFRALLARSARLRAYRRVSLRICCEMLARRVVAEYG